MLWYHNPVEFMYKKSFEFATGNFYFTHQNLSNEEYLWFFYRNILCITEIRTYFHILPNPLNIEILKKSHICVFCARFLFFLISEKLTFHIFRIAKFQNILLHMLIWKGYLKASFQLCYKMNNLYWTTNLLGVFKHVFYNTPWLT